MHTYIIYMQKSWCGTLILRANSPFSAAIYPPRRTSLSHTHTCLTTLSILILHNITQVLREADGKVNETKPCLQGVSTRNKNRNELLEKQVWTKEIATLTPIQGLPINSCHPPPPQGAQGVPYLCLVDTSSQAACFSHPSNSAHHPEPRPPPSPGESLPPDKTSPDPGLTSSLCSWNQKAQARPCFCPCPHLSGQPGPVLPPHINAWAGSKTATITSTIPIKSPAQKNTFLEENDVFHSNLLVSIGLVFEVC